MGKKVLFQVGDKVSPLPALFSASTLARQFLVLDQVYTVIETGVANFAWFIVEDNLVNWVDHEQWWKLIARKSPMFVLDEIA